MYWIYPNFPDQSFPQSVLLKIRSIDENMQNFLDLSFPIYWDDRARNDADFY